MHPQLCRHGVGPIHEGEQLGEALCNSLQHRRAVDGVESVSGVSIYIYGHHSIARAVRSDLLPTELEPIRKSSPGASLPSATPSK